VISGSGGLVKTGTGRLDLTANNTFSGQVMIQAGEIAVPALSNVGAASPLGAGSGANAAIAIGSTTSTAILRYTGGATTSDRPIQLAGSTGGANIAADGTGAIVLSGGISASAAGNKTLTLSGNNTGTNEISGIISNGSGLIAVTKSGTGRWILSGNNTYTGNTTLSAGELTAASNAAFGSGTLILQTAILSGQGTSLSIANPYVLGGNPTIAGSTPITFTGSGSITSNRTITSNNTATTTLSGPTLAFTAGNVTNTLTIAGTGNFAVSSVIQDGPGTGPDNVTQTTTGTLTLSGANAYSGTTTISAGTLAIGHNQAIGTSTLALNGGTIRADGAARTIANAITLGGTATVGGSLALTFNGTMTLTGTRTLTVSNTAITNFLNIALSNSATSRMLTFAGSGTTEVQGVISNGGTATASGLTKSGTGRLILSGANTYGGTTSVTAGTLEVRHNSALGAATAATTVSSGATLAYTNNITTGDAVSIAGTGDAAAGAITNISGNNTITATVTQTAASTITSQAGTLNISPATGNSVAGSFPLTLSGSGNVAVFRPVNIGTSTITKSGSGTFTLGGNGTHTSGAITVNGGTFIVLAALNSGSTVTVSSGATLETRNGSTIAKATSISGIHDLGSTAASTTFSSGISYAAPSSLLWSLYVNSTTGPGTNFDQILVSGGNLSVAAGATLGLTFNAIGSTVNWSDAFWNTTRQWTIIDFSGVGTSTGNFTNLTLTTDSAGQSLGTIRPAASFAVARIGPDIAVSYNPVPEPATTALILTAFVVLCWWRQPRILRREKSSHVQIALVGGSSLRAGTKDGRRNSDCPLRLCHLRKYHRL
jgi:autotransporter-associated beta strand protein